MGMASRVREESTGPWSRSMVFRMVETSVKISRIIIPPCQQESIEDSHEKAGKNRGKQLTRQEPYNIIMQYDKRRNGKKP